MGRGHSHHRSRLQNIKYFLKGFFFLKIAAHKVLSASLESTVFLASLLSLSLSLYSRDSYKQHQNIWLNFFQAPE